MDGHTLELEEAGFDISGSQRGVSLFPDMPRRLPELVRVTKPAGRVLIVALDLPTKVECSGFPMDPPLLAFQVRDPEKLRQQMADAKVET